MASGGAPVLTDTTAADISSAAQADNNELDFLRLAVRSLPSQVVKDLLSNGVSSFRFFQSNLISCLFAIQCSLHEFTIDLSEKIGAF